MDININPNLELNHKLVFTPKLQQSVKILQMSNLDLEKYINEEALENPLIEIESNVESLDYDDKIEKKLEWLNSIENDNKIYYKSYDNSANNIISNVYDNNTLQNHLLSQLNSLYLSKLEYNIAYYIIESLNDDGYLTIDLESISSAIGSDIDIVQNILSIVQSFDPIGVGARNLKECLMLQLQNNNVKNQKIYDLINNYLYDLSKNRLNFIASKMGINLNQIKELVTRIRSLNPRPGIVFNSTEQPRYVTPDIFVIKFQSYYEILLNDLSCPQVSLNSYYVNILKHTNDKEVKQYINKKLKHVTWIMNCIDQRNNTLKKVTTTIVNIQKDFFNFGPGHLVPMILEDVAEEIGMHISTVSRAIDDKYLQCSWGIYKLKYFFSSKIIISNDNNVASSNIKFQLKNIIKEENKKKPLSDQKITNMLNNNGIKISRRTVAKYRTEIGIPSMAMRKVF